MKPCFKFPGGFLRGNPGTALATVLGGTLLSPVLGGFSDLFGERLTASLYPAYLDPYTEDRDRSRSRRPMPSQLVLAAEVGVDLTERLNLSVLTAPNRSDIPAEAVLRYQATDTLELQALSIKKGAGKRKRGVFQVLVVLPYYVEVRGSSAVHQPGFSAFSPAMWWVEPPAAPAYLASVLHVEGGVKRPSQLCPGGS